MSKRSNGEALNGLTALLPGRPASRQVKLGNDEANPTSGGCGPNFLEPFAFFDLVSSLPRTRQTSLLSTEEDHSDEYSVRWPRAGTSRNGKLYPLKPLALGTREKGFFLLPTLTATFNNREEDKSKGRIDGLATVFRRLLPTLTVNGDNNRRGCSAKSGDGLATAMRRLPTLLSRDWQSGKISQRRQETRKFHNLNETLYLMFRRPIADSGSETPLPPLFAAMDCPPSSPSGSWDSPPDGPTLESGTGGE